MSKHMAKEEKVESTSTLRHRIEQRGPLLTPKGKILADFVLQNSRQAVFLRTRGLAKACEVSEATVVRFVNQLGYAGYSEFIQALRDLVDADLTLVDRLDISESNGQGNDRLGKAVSQEVSNLRELYNSLDYETIERVAGRLLQAPQVDVIGARLSCTFSYYLGWSLSKLRPGIRILNASDGTIIDDLALLPAPRLLVIAATSRYPNDLIRLGRIARRLGHEVVLITDSTLCPIIPFAHTTLVAPSKYFPIVGSPCSLSCLINCLVTEMSHQGGGELREFQERLEAVYRENDTFFNLEKPLTEE